MYSDFMQDTKHGLKRELRLQDLVFMQVLLVVGLNFTGYAAKQGSSHIALWMLAIILFYLPLAAVVVKLSRALPLEGGVYQWVKEGITPFAGYMAGWGLAVYGIFFFASFGSQLAEGFALAAGGGYSWMGTSKWFALGLTILLCLFAFVLNVRGLHAAKWLSGAGSLLNIVIFLILLYLLVKVWLSGKLFASAAFSLVAPRFSILSVNVFTKMALFALSGIDQCAIFTEECRKPKNDISRSVLIAAPLIALMYILATSALLAYVSPGNIDLAAPVSQLLQAGFGGTGEGHAVAAIAVGGFSVILIASLIIIVGMISRLPMVAGWDGLLPAWWSELNPQFRTPSKAIASVACCLMLVAGLSLVGAHNQEAVQVLSCVGFGSYCVVYLLMFGAILFGFRSSTWRPSIAIRLMALAAFSVVLVCLGFELVPIGEVADPFLFAVKVTGAICIVNGLGSYLYWRRAMRR